MADYIYLLENRLSPAQRNALRIVREIARSKNITVFLVGGAVRDLTSGSPVRDLDVVVQGNALKLRKDLEKAGAVVTGEIEAGQALFLSFPGSVRLELGSTLSVTYPKPGKAVYKPSSILDDLRRRDFTANAMALSLNEGSYGLLMDPLNGVADIENRELRLVSNYGFIEDPIRMVRAARFMARLGWALDEKTQQRYETGKEEGYIASISDFNRGYETEEIVHEEDPLRVLRRLESEGWMKHLAPFWTSAKADIPGLEHLREVQTQLQMQGIHPDASAANFPLLTAKLSVKEVAQLKAGFVRQGFVKEIDALDVKAKELANLLTGKAAALPSQSWKILTSAPPEAVLWVAYSSRSAPIQAKLKNFFTVWPQARQKMPYSLMQEMRIVPELPIYEELLEMLFFELMDEKLQTTEELKAFLEPHSPPAPPPTVTVRRPRAPKKDAKGARALKKAVIVDPDEDADDADLDADSEADSEAVEEIAHELEDVLTGALDELVGADSPIEISADLDDTEPEVAEDEDDDEPPPPVKRPPKGPVKAAPATVAAVKAVKAAPAPAKALAVPPEKPAFKPPKAAQPVKTVTPAKKAAPVASKASAKQATVAAPTSRRPLAAAKSLKTAPAPAKKSMPPAKKATAVKPLAKKAIPQKPVSKEAVGKVAPAKTSKPAPKTIAATKSAPAKFPAKKTPPPKSASKKTAPGKKRR